MENNSEQSFYEDADRSVILSIGMKRQGKTYLMMKFLMKAIKDKKFDEYHLVLPQFKTERDGKYKWLKYYKNVYIYNAYHKVVSDVVLKAMETKHVFFGVDDATAEFLNNNDKSVQKLLTCNEHGAKCSIWICVHSCKKVLTPLVRQMLNYIFIYKNSNATLLKQCWEEFFSMEFNDFNEFREMYKELVFNNENEAFMYSFNGKHAFGVKNFQMMQEEEPKPPKKTTQPKSNFKEINVEQENMKRSIWQSITRSKMKQEQQPEKKPKFIKMFGNV